MTEVEKKRLKLLNETRKIYRDKNTPPAIHPRYHTAYQSIYGESEEVFSGMKSSFLVRLVIALLLFFLIYQIDTKQMKIGKVNSQSIVQEVQRNLIRK